MENKCWSSYKNEVFTYLKTSATRIQATKKGRMKQMNIDMWLLLYGKSELKIEISILLTGNIISRLNELIINGSQSHLWKRLILCTYHIGINVLLFSPVGFLPKFIMDRIEMWSRKE